VTIRVQSTISAIGLLATLVGITSGIWLVVVGNPLAWWLLGINLVCFIVILLTDQAGCKEKK